MDTLSSTATMHSDKLSDPITEQNAVEKYKFTSQELWQAVINQKIHWKKRITLGTEQLYYERGDIINLCLQNIQKGGLDRKRKHEGDDTNEPPTKKQRADTHSNDPKTDYLSKYKWLTQDCNQLNEESRNKIISYLNGKYIKNDVDKEDVLINKRVDEKGLIRKSVFRMLFKERKWKKVAITTRKKEIKPSKQ
eukprot:71355_1